ncbi:pyrroloquinoline quinone biosynthesis protein PqqB [Thioflexithrix psekupsensis]|uniref:Coenzyme PQQ synthesis protein B n=1 Tax=Thioflexithrix psekupsensis TaxID=1570016 RepID=A0A251X4E3_9GAMM|nr:pyrroloquinoline quinone biosynthesis protein PqqB [Thioflexithrix psekupsensis]OUD12266.1 pyrroloquinoline quinone biosynthesis protein PqqB [Thioflexithrix psekupsensis]
MYIHILGSSAGGGFPQWNCNCANCHGLRQGTIQATRRTQSSIAISGDGVDWLLINASPDLLSQLAAFSALQPAQNVRDTAIRAVLLIDSQIDHTTGLLMLREGCPLPVYCTEMVHQDLSSGFPLFTLLRHWNGGLQYHTIALDQKPFTIKEINGITLTAFPLRSKAPPYSPHREQPHPGDNIGLLIQDIHTGKSAFYAPGLGEIEAHLPPIMAQTDCLLVDGTFWSEDEMQQVGVSDKPARALGHLPQSGADGMIAFLNTLTKPRKILIHINNTNPILNENSPERAELTQQGIEVAFDGMAIEL